MSTNNNGNFAGYYYRQQPMYGSQWPGTGGSAFTTQPQQQGLGNFGFQQPQQGMYMPQFPQMPSGTTIQTPGTGTAGVQVPGMLPIEQSYIENILRLNRGKLATVYMTFEGSTEWNSKVFKGIVEAAGRDHLILSDPETGFRYLLPMVFFSYAVFEEELEYEYPFAAMQQATYSPR